MSGAVRALIAAALACAMGSAAAATPDLTGVWINDKPVDMLKAADGGAPPLKPEAKAIYDQHRAAAARGDRSFDGVPRCLPPGLPRLMLMKQPFEILQREKTVYFVYQINRLPRRIYMNESLPQDPDPLYLGYSVAHWDGNALVIDTVGFNDSTLLDNAGLPHSDALHLTERYELAPDGAHLRAHFTIDDPMTFTKTWTARAEFVRKPGYELREDVCAARLATPAKP